MAEALGEPIAHGLWTLADHLDGHHFTDATRKAISSAARDVIEAVGEHPGCPACGGDGWVVEDADEDKAVPCSACESTGMDLPEIVQRRFEVKDAEIERLRGRVGELAECAGQTSLEEAG